MCPAQWTTDTSDLPGISGRYKSRERGNIYVHALICREIVYLQRKYYLAYMENEGKIFNAGHNFSYHWQVRINCWAALSAYQRNLIDLCHGYTWIFGNQVRVIFHPRLWWTKQCMAWRWVFPSLSLLSNPSTNSPSTSISTTSTTNNSPQV